MRIFISHVGSGDLIIQSNAQGNRRLRPLSWWDRFLRRSADFEIGDNELIVIRTTKTVEPDTGIPLRTTV